MNRELLKDIFVGDGHSYANDALQTICHVLVPFNNNDIMKWVDSNTAVNYKDRPKEFHDAVNAQHTMIELFNSIVAQGEEFALSFINNNQSFWRY